jgi:hypothetical protein
VDTVGLLEYVLHLPYAYAWLPGLVFLVVVGVIYWMWRPTPKLAEALTAEVQTMSPTPAPTPAAPEQRNMHRRHGNPVEVFVAPPDDKKNPGTGSVIDRSMGGMRLALFSEVAIGAVLSVRPVNADDIVPWVDVEIRSCRLSAEMPGRFEIGCQYVKSPPYSIQLLFG